MSLKRIDLTPDKRLFFLHIPKTAGVTLRSYLDRRFRADEIFPYQQWSDIPARVLLEDLLPYRFYRGHFYLSSIAQLLPEPLLVATMIRHPIKRALSAYHHALRDPAHPHHQMIGGSNAALKDFIEMEDKLPSRSTQVVFLAFEPPGLRTIDWARLQPHDFGDLEQFMDVDRAAQVLEGMSFVGITDQLEASFQLLSYVFKWNPVVSIDPSNSGDYDRDLEQYDPEVLKLLNRLNRADLDLYSWAKQLVIERHGQMVNALVWRDFKDRETHSANPKKVYLDFAEAIAGEGWYDREVASDGRVFCWMGLRRKASVVVGIKPATLMQVRLGVIHAVSETVLRDARVTVNKCPVAMRVRWDAQEQLTTLEGEFFGSVVEGENGLAVVEIETDLVRPCDMFPFSEDNRQLGVAVTWLRLEPSPTK